MIFHFLLILFILAPTVDVKRLTKPQEEALKEHEKCREAKSVRSHPLDCCSYPRFYDNPPALTNQCSYTCRMLPYPLFTCLRNCIIEYYGVLKRSRQGVIGPNRIYQAFYDQDEQPGVRPLSPQWLQILANTTFVCLAEFPLHPISRDVRNVSSEENWNYFYTNYVECIRKLNFLECRINQTVDCLKIQNAVRHCYINDYPFLHELFFEDFYYRNKTEMKRLRMLKEANKPDLYAERVGDEEVQPTTTENVGTAEEIEIDEEMEEN